MGFSIGIDTGGTFTDVATMNEAGEATICKTPTTGTSLDGVFNGLALAAEASGLPFDEFMSQITKFVYGSTFATNVIVQRTREGCTGLLTTRGFRDTLVMRRMFRRSNYDIQEDYPEPFVPRSLTREVTERMDSSGNVLTPVDLGEAREAVRALVEKGVEAIAICFLHAYANPEHERQVAEMIRAAFPSIYVSVSSELAPQIREYERTSTTVLNAYVGPAMVPHLDEISRRFATSGLRVPPLLMQSNGGVTGVAEARNRPIELLYSGPAGGVIGANYVGSTPAGGVIAAQMIASAAGLRNMITIDMGGTSFDVGLIKDGEINTVTQTTVADWALLSRIVEIHSIGAGGGSIAAVDERGMVKVGPRSAGANPGPACYCRGGTDPTVTDADVVLGYIDPDYFLGGRIKLDRDLAYRAIEEKIARPLGIGVVEAAAGIYRVINSTMTDAIRVVSVGRGYDPRDFVLMAFGGAGPVHAGALHRELGSSRIVVPDMATGLSAFGLLASNLKHSYARTMRSLLSSLDVDLANQIFAEMKEKSLQAFSVERIAPSQVELCPSFDMSYRGQLHEINVPISSVRLTKEVLAEAERSLGERYARYYGFSEEGTPAQVTTLRLDAIGSVPQPILRRIAVGSDDASAALKGKRSVHFDEAGGFVETPVYASDRVTAGNQIAGPAIVEYPGTTVVIGPGQGAVCDEWRNLIIS